MKNSTLQNDKFGEIVKHNRKREEDTLAQYACKSSDGKRQYPDREKVADEDNYRPMFSHDVDKIIHSRAYTRYIDKTQVFCLFENDHITHRVLHVQLVSKIGRVIGRCLRLNEDLIEAIALGHDLGHAPYGHDGEKILNQICIRENIGFFRHNAQSVKLLLELEEKGRGLNLTLQVLDGILSHNGEIPSNKLSPKYEKDWSVFKNEYTSCFQQEDGGKNLVPMTLEGCVARVADIIGYIGRDIEDAVTLRVIDWKEVPRDIRDVLGSGNDEIVNTLVTDLIENSYEKNYLALSEQVFTAMTKLKDFNEERIYSNPDTNTQFSKMQNMYNQIYQRYYRDLKGGNSGSYISEFIGDMESVYRKNNNNKRIVIDCLAGMTDDFFCHQYQELFVPQTYGYSLER